MRSVRLVIFFLFVAALMGTTAAFAEGQQGKDGKPHTVDWYMAPENNDALHEKLAYCNSIRGAQGNTEDCNNARLAGRKLRSQSPVPKIK